MSIFNIDNKKVVGQIFYFFVNLYHKKGWLTLGSAVSKNKTKNTYVVRVHLKSD